MNNDTFAHRRAFYFLKKYSSYTWCAEICRLTKQFAEELERILRNPPATFGPVLDLDEMYMRDFWYACGKMEEGLALLLQADRMIGYTRFDEGDSVASSGLYGVADRGASCRYIENEYNEEKYRALGYSGDYRTVSTGIFALLEQAMALENYENPTTHTKTDRVWNHPELLNNYRWPKSIASGIREVAFPFPRWHPSSLEEVPQPIKDAQVIVSGDEVPITGIWQPEPDTPMTDKEKNAWGIDSENYCMNFLIQGHDAPLMHCQEVEEIWFSETGKHYYSKRPKEYKAMRLVRWRLLWADDRYGKNGIPEEEKDYLRTDQPQVATPVADRTLRAKAGQPCPKAGVWKPQDANAVERAYQAGDILADLRSAYGFTVWQWVRDR